ncbi:triose-phosphate transporter family-domain-containing protein [Crucibulum laeve]|uniref:Triose-phosphate transporter family-domain-containing protein n=1 Tax=Crucibulum laeve TaxID=68775 RepID=A0A5C3MGD6_9AGAR|nr:triose-phosphate transporter family-domain-containing protein [Crucibulum laeve]
MERQYNTTLDEYSRVEPLASSSRASLSYEEDGVTPDTANVHLASLDEKKRLWWRNATINTLFIASWFFFATILSVYNKWMFSPSHFGFPSPLFVTTGHMFVQFILAMILRTLWPRKFRPEHNPQPKDYSLKVIPTAIATSLDIGLSNLSLKTITLSFYTMCKSSSLIFVLLFAFLFRLETFSWRLIGVIFLIFSGVLLMVATETHFILEGFLLVLSASGLGGLRWSLTQLLLKNKKVGLDNPAATVYWLSPVMGVTLAIISVLLGEWSKLFGTEFFRGAAQTIKTVLFLTAPGAIAFCMVLSEFYIIQRTGVVPMSIAGIAKEVTTITISAWFFNDQLTPLNITGVMITICGICLFTFHKYRKSIKSTVPLDAHGNPIQAEDEWLDEIDGFDGYDRGETTRLTSVPHVRDSEQVCVYSISCRL